MQATNPPPSFMVRYLRAFGPIDDAGAASLQSIIAAVEARSAKVTVAELPPFMYLSLAEIARFPL